MSGLAARARDGAARLLLAIGLSPDAVTWMGFAVSLVAAAFLWKGASDSFGALPVLASASIALAGGLDMIDGTMARLSGRVTKWGGVLDSSLDRVSDAAIYGAIGVHFALRGEVALSTLAWLALAHGFFIAYLRSRTEVVTAHAAVGFWQRTERNTALGVAAALGHVPAALWLLGTVPAFTAWRRWRHVSALLRDAPDPEGRPRWPRGSAAYVTLCAIVIAFIAWSPDWLPR